MANLDNIARGAIRLFAGLLLTCWACAALAEGTRTLYPAAYPAAGFRADLDLTGGTYGGVTTRRQFIYVYANAGEYILLGSSNRNNGGDIFVYNPQSFGAKGAETIPSTANFTCSAVAAGPNYGGGTRGFLDTRANELLGPKSADGTTGSGFTPCSYLAPSTGIYGVSFTVATAGGTGPTGSVATLHPGSVTVPGWDVAVRNGVTSTTDINARVFTYAYVAFTGGNNLPLYTTLYYATLDGVRYQQTLQGFDPNGFALWANVAGFLDNGQPLYKDIRAADAQITPGGGQFIAELSAQTPQMPVFFNTIDPAGANAASATTVLQALGIPLSPPIPQLSSVSFTGAQSGNTTYVSAGGTFQFTTMDDTTYQIVISRDGVDFDPGTPTNAALTGLAPDGVNTVLWNGLASDGSTFPASATPYQYKVVGRNGEIHFPIIDDEGNKFGGPTLTKLNGGSVGDHTAFYDDRGYRTRNGVLIGVAPDGLLCPGNPPIPPTPDHSLIGQDSNANTFSGANCNGGAGTCYYRYWPGNGNSNADCAAAAGFGDAKALDLWSYQQTPITTQTVIIDPQPATAKVATSVSVPPTAGPGSTVNGSFVFENVGGTSATGTTYTVQIGTPGSCPAGVTFLSPPGVTFTFNAATCTYTLTSPPATLPAGQQLNFNFSYTAPASGSVPVTTNINSTNGGSATATGTTQIIAADVTTTVTVPASAAAGSTVSGTITFSNAAGATATANGVAYNTTIGTPGSCPAGVTFTSLPPGVTATYNSTSCQVTYSGMPASLTAGQTLSIGFQYTGPATAGTVPVSSSISTTTPESNAANNTASGSTTFLSANLSITKTDGTASVNAGATVTYTIVVSNAGPSAANGAIFQDPAVANLVVTNVTCGSPTGGAACPTAGNTTVALMQGSGIVIPTLPSGGSVTFTVTGTAGATGNIVNTATVTAPAGVSDPNAANNSATDTDTINPVADLSISKTDGVTSVNAGATVTYTIVVSNAGPSGANGATFKDSAVGNLTVTNVTCGSASGGAACPAAGSTTVALMQGAGITIPTLPSGGSVTFTVTGTAGGSGTIANSAMVTAPAGVTDPTLVNNSSTDTDTINPVADLSITKTDGVTTATPGGSVTYTITASNAGPSAVVGATVADTFPAAITSATWTCAGAGGGTCPASGSGNINLSVNLPVGGSVTFTVTANISPSATGTLSNTATVTAPAGVTDPTPGNNTATDSDTLNPVADLSITKTDGTTTYTPGATTTYTIVATNNGPSAVTGATITDTFGASFTADTWTATATGGASGFTASGSGNINDTVNMPVGSTITYTVSATISLAATGNVSNTATIAVPAGVSDPTPGNNSATDTDTNGGTQQLSISKSATPAAFAVGQSGTYSLLVSNTGTTSTAGAISISDPLPSGITTSATPSGTGWNCSASTATAVSCTTAAVLLPGGNAPVISVPITVGVGASPAVTNTATVQGGGDATCPAAAHCQSTITTPVNAALINVTKTLSGSLVVGVQTNYVITATNNGQAATLAGTITDTIPTGLTIGTLPAGCSASGQNLTCTLPAGIATGGSISYTIPVTPQSSVNGTNVSNTATDNGGGDPSCPAAGHCNGTTTNTVTAPQLSLTKSATPSTFVVNQPATYTLTLTNTGTAATTATTTISDAIPGGLTIGTLPAGCTATGQTVTCTVSAPLNTGTPVTFNIPVTPTNALNGTSVTNTAGATGGGDPGCPNGPPVGSLPARCVGSVTTAVNAPQLSIQKTASAPSFVVGVGASYTLQVTNTGSAATNASATVTDVIPASLTIGTLPAGCTATGQQVTCTIAGGLATGTSVSFVIPVTPTASAVPSVSNTATVQGGGDPTCPITANCKSTITTPVNAPQLSIQKTASAASFVVGVGASYTLQVTNTGTAATTATATVTDNIPGTLTIGTLAAGCTAAGQTVTCTIASGLATGNSVSFVIPVTPTPAANGTTLSNTATVMGGGDPTCPGGANCSSTVTTPVNAPALKVVKTASASNFFVGVAASYTLQVTNTGSAATTATTTITDNIPGTLTIGTLPAGCTNAGQTVICTIAAGLATGSPVSFVIPVTPTAAANGTTLSNTATVSGGGDPACPGGANCSSTVTTPVNAPALQIVKTASSSTFTVGVAASYTLTVTNIGGAATTATTTATDNIPSTLTIGTLPAGCSAAGQVVTCTIAAGLATNSPVSFVIPVTPTPTANGTTLSNTATVSGGGDPSCPNQNNANCSSTVDTPVNQPALRVQKTASAPGFVVGTPASYSLTVTDIGSAATTAVTTVTDNIPSTLAVGALPAGCTAFGQVVTCTIAAGLATNTPVSFVIPVTPTAAANGTTVVNTATVSGGGDPSCPSQSNANCSSTVTTPVSAPALGIVKTASSSSFTVNVPASYTLTVTNIGGAATTAVATVSDNIPGTLTIGTLPAGCSASGQAVTCTIASGLAAGVSRSFVIPVTPAAAASGATLSNTATVSGGGDPSCPAGANCSSTVTTPVGAPRLQIVKTASGAAFAIGVPASYTLTVTNTGNAATTAAATITDNIYNTLTIGTLPAGCSASGQQVTCTIAAGLAPNAAASFAVPVTPTAAAGGTTVTNTAVVSGGGDPSCPAGSNCSSTVSTPVPAAATSADLRIVKTGPVQVTAGQNIVYTVSVTNTGPDTALNVVLSDPTPAGLSFVSSGAPCASFPCSLGNLTANQTVTISNVTFYVPTNYAGNSVTNVASVTSATPDPTPNNNSSSVSTTILPAATQSAAAVPINSRWMLLMMVLLLVGLGIVKTRAHR